VGENAPAHAERSGGSPANDRLDSWKEIGAYLKRDVTTVRRWEKREGLPVHRHRHNQRESVYAFRSEVDRWWQSRRNHLADKSSLNGAINGRPRERLAWSLAGALLATTLALGGILAAPYFREPANQNPQLRFSIHPPDGASFGTVTLSPDGRQLAFTAALNGQSMLWVRPLRSLTPQALPGTEGAAFPFWSPDGRSIGFFALGRLKRIDVAGGGPQILAEAPGGRGGTWNAAGVIVFSPDRGSGLVRLPATGGPVTPVSTVDQPAERGHLWPHFLPDGNHFLYLADSARNEHDNLFVGALASPDRKRILDLVSNATYGRDGYLLFARNRQLVAQVFDPQRLELTGEPFIVADGVLQQWDLDHKTDFSVSDAGILVYRGMRAADTRLVWRDRSGEVSILDGTPKMYCEPALSPDEKQVAVGEFHPRPSPRAGFGAVSITSDIWLWDTLAAVGSPFTFDQGAEFAPVWSPDGTRIAFSSNRRGSLDLYLRSATGAGEEELLDDPNGNKWVQAWSPDGRFVVYGTADPVTRADLWLLPLSGDRRPTPLLRSEFSEEQAQFSPDGRWLSYTSDESGRSEVYVQDFPSLAGKWRISRSGGGDARWRADGRELFYIAEDRRLMAVPVSTGGTLRPGVPTALFDTGLQPHWGMCRNHYDVSRDGKRFIFTAPVDDDRFAPFTIVVNWTAGLRSTP
jgi:Tol biopolymer transport system component